MKAREIAVGERYGRLVVLEPGISMRIKGVSRLHARVKCDCGTERLVMHKTLVNPRYKSCGCVQREKAGEHLRTHGESHTRLYLIWKSMVGRCHSFGKSTRLYKQRGISVCPEWRDYLVFRDWALANGYEADLSIDRKDHDEDYRPENCRWVTQSENSSRHRNNTSLTAFDETKTLSQWVRDPRCVVSYSGLRRRLANGFDPEAALASPKIRELHVYP